MQNFPPKQEHHNFKSRQIQLESFIPFNYEEACPLYLTNVPKELQSLLKIILTNEKMLKITKKISIDVKIKECFDEHKIEEIVLLKCSNKRDQQKYLNKKSLMIARLEK